MTFICVEISKVSHIKNAVLKKKTVSKCILHTYYLPTLKRYVVIVFIYFELYIILRHHIIIMYCFEFLECQNKKSSVKHYIKRKNEIWIKCCNIRRLIRRSAVRVLFFQVERDRGDRFTIVHVFLMMMCEWYNTSPLYDLWPQWQLGSWPGSSSVAFAGNAMVNSVTDCVYKAHKGAPVWPCTTILVLTALKDVN